MMHSSPSASSFGRRFGRSLLAIFAAAAVLGMFTGCDAVKVRSPDDASGGDRSSKLRIDAEALNEANLFFESGPISEGEALSIELVDNQNGEAAARITHEGGENGKKLLKTDFRSLQPTSVTMECRNHGKVLYSEKTNLAPTSSATTHGDDDDDDETESVQQEPDSYHYQDTGETIDVGVDYNDDSNSQSAEPSAAAVQFKSSTQTRQCTHIYFTLEGVSESFSPDGILFSGKTDNLRMKEKELR